MRIICIHNWLLSVTNPLIFPFNFCLEKAFDNTEWRPKERLPVAKELGETSLMFLVHPTFTQLEIEKTCTVISDVMQKAEQ